MTKQDPWFFEMRAVAFASLLLTRRKDVAVRAQDGADRGVDLLVELLDEGKSTLRFFGVRLIAFLDLPDHQEADQRVRSQLSRDAGAATLPVCVFVVGVRKPAGICRWVVAPIVEDGRPVLRRDLVGDWQALDEAGVDRLIGQVHAWCDALNGHAAWKQQAATGDS